MKKYLTVNTVCYLVAFLLAFILLLTTRTKSIDISAVDNIKSYGRLEYFQSGEAMPSVVIDVDDLHAIRAACITLNEKIHGSN